MSQVKVNLQPPPNVDFVTGYPGIPPGPDRPQASVKGAIEVRAPAQGVKAKWVRIELRKVETLSGGGPSNTFYDFVGPSPVNLWNSPDEYSLLRSQDFPFSIRIPESIPPTVALDNKAGISYELVASVCTKGKRGFLRKAKSVVVSSIAPITIDKHELHATWPVYCQPEERSVAQDGVTLIVARKNTCYGPGDRVSVNATVKSDSLHTVILRGYEFFLTEKTVFTVGVHAAGRKNAAPAKSIINIAETKVPVNATLYGGTQNTAELAFMISGNHTTTTLNAARHIDVTYSLCIRALMGTGTHIVLELPVIISNWQRHVSYEAINRIGPAPSLSLLPVNQTLPSRIEPSRGRPSDIIAATLPINRANSDFNNPQNRLGMYNTVAGGASSTAPRISGDDHGYGSPMSLGRGLDDFGSSKPIISVNSTSTGASLTSATNTNTLPSAMRNTSAPRNLHVKNGEVTPESVSRNRSGQATGSNFAGSSTSQSNWPTAEEEKRRYEQARDGVIKVHGPESAPPPASMRPTSPASATTSSPPRGAPAASAASKQFLSAEEEKRMLFEQAQRAVQAKQGQVQDVKADSRPPLTSSASSKLTPAEFYQQAVNSRAGGGLRSGQAGGSSHTSPSRQPPVLGTGPQYMTAEQEKAALRRYEEAKRAVELSQGGDEVPSSNPIAYDSLYPSSKPAASGSSSQPVDDAPPSFEAAAGGNNIMAHLSEKERLRRAYEASDAAAMAQAKTPPPALYAAPPPAPAPTPAPAPAPAVSLPDQYANALEEKDAVRKKLEARDAQLAAKANKQNTQTPPRANTASPNGAPVPSSPGRSPTSNAGFRPTPQPPAAASRVLTAAEEKALLQARFEAREGGRKATASPPVPAASQLAPPPLMPRPPVEYIKETQDEDARLSRLNSELVPNLDNGAPKANGVETAVPPSGAAPGLDMKPFTPFRSAFDPPSATPGPPPPLPKSGE